jgi:subtilisin-like proprotein convertase family protein
MRRHLRHISIILVLFALVISGLLISASFRSASAQRGGVQRPGGPPRSEVALSAAAQAQIAAILAEKQSLSPAEKKIHSMLRNGIKAKRGERMTLRGEVTTLRSAARAAANTDAKDRMLVNIKGKVDKTFIRMVQKLDGQIINAQEGSVRAWVPWASLEAMAGHPDVRAINPGEMPITHRQLSRTRGAAIVPAALPFKTIPSLQAGSWPDFDQRAMNVRRQITAALAKAGARRAQDFPQTNTGSVTSQGDTALGALAGRNFFGVNGAGVKIGVLSDGVNFLDQSVASGDLPPDVTVLPGQEGPTNNIGEGTAMLEIIYDLAPGAKLFFATAFNGVNSFADNIRALRAAGCDIIVDDVIYSNESPFHDDIISTAVEEVVADGALYFSSAGNDGNFNDGTSSVWEGDFKNSRTTLPSLPGGTLHDFGSGVIANRVESDSPFVLGLWWSDPLGASDNDYDLFIMDNSLTTVIDASITVQDGDDDPYEVIFGALAGERILIFKSDGAKRRALHLNNFGGQLGIGTSGSTHGHNSVAGAFSVAAINAALAGTGTFTGGPANPVELLSSDGYRRVFFKSDGTPFTPGSLLFSNNGGELRKKPDLTATDGVATSVPGFATFFGTSAAAPHAAAIAALLKSAKPRATPNRIRQALTRTAIDIEAIGRDRDSGAGIVSAFDALFFIGAAPSPFLELGTLAITDVDGDGDNIVEPGEGVAISAPLTNVGGATALGISATLTSTAPGVTIVTATSSYPNIGSNGQSATNMVPLTFNLASTAGCGQVIDFTLTVNYANSSLGPQVSTFSIQTGQLTSNTVSYTGSSVPIPDASPAGVNIPIVVSGLTGPVSDLKFSFDGSSCTTATGATTVGLDHTWVGDLVITLTSPAGTTVTLMNRAGTDNNFGQNFCNTVLDDSATALIQSISPVGAPYTGMFKPANPLSAFNGEIGNGTWTLNVSDLGPFDTGNVRAFSLSFKTFACTGP